jgi:hypothetical protein
VSALIAFLIMAIITLMGGGASAQLSLSVLSISLQ